MTATGRVARSSVARPVRVRPLVLLALLALALFGVARTTGAGWLVVLVSGVAGLVPLAVAWPALEIRRTTVDVVAPRDAVVGRPLDLVVSVSGNRHPLLVRTLEPVSEWRSAPPSGSGIVPVVPSRRGVLTTVVGEVRSGAPLGLVWWRRRVPVTLDRPVEVAPAPVPTAVPVPDRSGSAGEARMRGMSGADSVRSLREYQLGDPIRLVHWAATARTGDLVVKELEGPDAPRTVVTVDLSGSDDDAVERAASTAAGLVASLLRAGLTVTLATREADGPAVGAVSTPVDTGRRLARAVGGRPADGPWPPGTAVLRVSTAGVVRERG